MQSGTSKHPTGCQLNLRVSPPRLQAPLKITGARTDKTSVPVKSAFCECTFKLTAGFTDSRQVFGSQSLP